MRHSLYLFLRSLYISYQAFTKRILFFCLPLLPIQQPRLLLQSASSSAKYTCINIPYICLETLERPSLYNRLNIISNAFALPALASFPTIEIWASHNLSFTCLTNNFIVEQYHALRHSHHTNVRMTLDKSVAVLPYMTSQFGHFIGDCLGSLFFYASSPSLRHSLPILSIYPSDEWRDLIRKIFPDDSFEMIHPADILDKNILVKSPSCILPRLSPMQNLQFASYYIGKYLDTAINISKSTYIPHKVFLTTLKTERIQNSRNLTAFLEANGFTILTISSLPLEQLLFVIRQSEILISEQGSIHQNVLVSRLKPYYLLTSESSLSQTAYEAHCGAIYSDWHSHLIQRIFCRDYVDERNLHPYSRPIYVDLDDIPNSIL